MAWTDRLAAAAAHVEGLSTRQALGWLLLVTLLATVPLVAAMYVDHDPSRVERTDVPIFRDRTDTILRGDWLYRDTELQTLTPPLINYLMVVPNVAGDTLVHWELYFSLWNFATAAVLYLGLRPLHRGLAFGAAAVYVTSPFAYYTSVTMVQDDTVVPVFLAGVMAALVARGSHIQGALWSGAGTLVKAWPGIAAPILFFDAQGVKAKLKVAVAGFGVALLVCLPFLLVVPDGFNAFLRFYLLGESPDGEFDGLSLWRFLWLRGWDVPQKLNLALLVVAYLALWWGMARRRIAALPALAVSYCLLFVLYPKLHFGYYLLGMVVVLPWAVTRPARLWGLLAAALVARVAHLFWRERIPTEGVGIFGAVLLAAALIGYWAWWARRVHAEGDFRPAWDGAATAPVLAVGAVQLALALATAIVMAAGRAWM